MFPLHTMRTATFGLRINHLGHFFSTVDSVKCVATEHCESITCRRIAHARRRALALSISKLKCQMQSEPKPVELRVRQHGAVRVNAASVYREAPGIVCIYVDMHSKYVEQPMVGSGDGEPPTLYFTPGERALHLDESKPRDSLTVVEFPEYVGWTVFACDGPARYTLGVVLVAPESSS